MTFEEIKTEKQKTIEREQWVNTIYILQYSHPRQRYFRDLFKSNDEPMAEITELFRQRLADFLKEAEALAHQKLESI